MNTLRHATVFLALLAVLLTACGRSAPTHFYLLDSGQPPLTADALQALARKHKVCLRWPASIKSAPLSWGLI